MKSRLPSNAPRTNMYCRSLTRRVRPAAFTLVEILVVIAIIGVLAAIAVPAINGARLTAKSGAMRAEVESLAQAVAAYESKYQAFPPDFLDWQVVERHYRRAFPNISQMDLEVLQRACDVDITNDAQRTTIQAHDPEKIDRAEALVFALGGFSTDPEHPFTGKGGPFDFVGDTANQEQRFLPAFYQINPSRDNRMFEFEEQRLTLRTPDATLALGPQNKVVSIDESTTDDDPPAVQNHPWDLFPVYLSDSGGPYVYFDSRTYTSFVQTPNGPAFNGYRSVGGRPWGVVRPYFSDQPRPKKGTGGYGSGPAGFQASLKGWEIINPKTFQIIGSGLDASFGSVASFQNQSGDTAPLYFRYPSGSAITADATATAPAGLEVPGTKGFLEPVTAGADENFQLDNVTNFSTATLVDDVQE